MTTLTIPTTLRIVIVDTLGGKIMLLKVQKWGNSLALRIPKAFADETRLKPGSKVNFFIKDGKLVIEPILDENRYALDDLLSKVTE